MRCVHTCVMSYRCGKFGLKEYSGPNLAPIVRPADIAPPSFMIVFTVLALAVSCARGLEQPTSSRIENDAPKPPRWSDSYKVKQRCRPRQTELSQTHVLPPPCSRPGGIHPQPTPVLSPATHGPSVRLGEREPDDLFIGSAINCMSISRMRPDPVPSSIPLLARAAGSPLIFHARCRSHHESISGARCLFQHPHEGLVRWTQPAV